MTQTNPPAHVPTELVKDFDIYFAPSKRDPWEELSALHDEAPDIFWNLKADPMVANGTWVVTRQDIIKKIAQDTGNFSNNGMVGYAESIGENWQLIPLEIDPPEHIYYRIILNKELAPKALDSLEPSIRRRAIALIEDIAKKESIDFSDEFGMRFPIGVYFELTGLPEDKMPLFFGWVHTLLHTFEEEPRKNAIRSIREVLTEQIADRRSNPSDDLTSKIVHAKVDGRSMTEDELIGALFMLFIGGQDTVTATIGSVFHYLATHPEDRERLRNASQEELVDAVEEFLRLFSVVVAKRRVTQDVVIEGVQMKVGDYIAMIYSLGSLDPKHTACPMQADFTRAPNRHVAFGMGPHRCVGSNLARMELRIAIEEWLKRIPEFSLDPDQEILAHSGIYGLVNLPLILNNGERTL